jgi:ADP-ribose pyrophosphatase
MSYITNETVAFTGSKIKVVSCHMDFGNDVHRVYERIDFDTKTGVSVLPIESNGVILLKHYQLGLDAETWTLPTGGLELNDDPKQRACWELEEEAGYTSNTIELMLRTHQLPGYIGSDPGYIFMATNLQPKTRQGDEPFPITVAHFSWDELFAMIKSNEIIDSRTLLSLLYYDRIFRR